MKHCLLFPIYGSSGEFIIDFSNIDSFFVDDFGLVTSFGRNFVFYVLDRFFYTSVFFLFQICLFLPAMMQIGDQPLKISDVIIA